MDYRLYGFLYFCQRGNFDILMAQLMGEYRQFKLNTTKKKKINSVSIKQDIITSIKML